MKRKGTDSEKTLTESKVIAPRRIIPSSVETFLIDADGILTYSKGFDLACFGTNPGPESGLSVFDLFQEEPQLLATIRRALKGESVTTEAVIDGSTYTTTYSPVLDCNGKVQHVIGVSLDITESKNASEIIRKSEFRLRALFNSAHDGIFTTSEEIFIDCNEAILRIFQCTKDQIIGQPIMRFSPTTQPNGRLSKDMAEENIRAVLNGQPRSFEWKHLRYDGAAIDTEVSLNRIDLEGEVQVQAIIRDVSKRKHEEEEHRQLAMVANATTNIVLLGDHTGRITWVNPAFTRITGYTLDEVVGKKPGSFLRGHGTDKWTAKFIKDKITAGQGFKDVDIMSYTKEGTPFWISVEVQPIHDSNGNVIQFVAIESDITERKAIQQALEDRNEALSKINAELDRFVYSASHDLRAPIASLLGLIEVARLEQDMNSMQHLLDMQEKSLLRLDRFIKDIVDHSRNTRQKIEAEPIHFESLAKATFEQLQFMENVSHIRKEVISEQKGSFSSDLCRLDIIINNLLSNALKYCDLRKEDPFVEVRIKSTEHTAEIRVKDNGEGIPTDARAKIFDMFYRASQNGSGSGLGLYIVKEAVQKIGGSISVHSEIGRGTEFVVQIPNLQSRTV